MGGGGGERNACRVLVEKSDRKRPLGMRGPRWKDNIEMGVKQIGWEGMGWICVA